MRPYERAKIAAGEERRRLTVQLRSEGRTFREIAAKLGVSPARASQLYHRALELNRERQRPVADAVTPQTPVEELPISQRTVVALQYGNYRTLADLLPIDRERIQRLLMLPNFVRANLEEVIALVANLG